MKFGETRLYCFGASEVAKHILTEIEGGPDDIVLNIFDFLNETGHLMSVEFKKPILGFGAYRRVDIIYNDGKIVNAICFKASGWLRNRHSYNLDLIQIEKLRRKAKEVLKEVKD